MHAIGSAVGATHVVELDQPAVGLQNPSGSGRQWNGSIYVATPALLRAYGINPAVIPSNIDILSSRPGLAGSGVQLTFGRREGWQQLGPARAAAGAGVGPGNNNPCNSEPVHGSPGGPGGEPAAHGHVGPQFGDHRERAASAASRGARTALADG